MDVQTHTSLVFFINGHKVTDVSPKPSWSLLYYIREKHLTGSKEGCGQGGCGACTVMLSGVNRVSGKIWHKAVPACLIPVCGVHGLSVTTVEGVGSTRTKVHPIQESLALSYGTQCGFCSPGMVMSMYTLLRNNPKPTELEIEAAIRGNLCRCTGYRPILEGFRRFADVQADKCPMGDKCCKNIEKVKTSDKLPCYDKNDDTDTSHKVSEQILKYEPSQEPIFPSELQVTDIYDKQLLKYKEENVTWYRPISLAQLLALRTTFQDAVLIAANSYVLRIGMLEKETVLISTSAVPELQTHTVHENNISFGASMSMADIERILEQQMRDLPEQSTRYFRVFKSQFRTFTGIQIKNMATIGDRVMTLVANAFNTTLACMPATATFLIPGKQDEGEPVWEVQNLDQDFYLGIKEKNNDGKILMSVNIPKSNRMDYIASYQELDKSPCVTFRIRYDDEHKRVQDLFVAIGNQEKEVESFSFPKLCTDRTQDDTPLSAAAHEISSLSERFDPVIQSLVSGYFSKFSETIMNYASAADSSINIPEPYDSCNACVKGHNGIQVYENVPFEQGSVDPTGRILPHESAIQHACGEAGYVDDIPHISTELQVAFCLSTRSNARIVKIDTSLAMQMPGVVDVITHRDVPAMNMFGFGGDEYIFAENNVNCYGQIIAAVVAETKNDASNAALRINIEYEDLKPVIITIQDAIRMDSFYENKHHLQHGDITMGFASSDHILEEEVSIGGQEHFYMETVGCLVVPKREHNEFEVWASTQSIDALQSGISVALGIPSNRIVVKAKRLGGGFGGKEFDGSKCFLPAAVAAFKLNRPVRCVLSRKEDLLITGAGHPMLAKYKVGVRGNGQIMALEMDIYCNGGSTSNITSPLLMYAVMATSGAYHVPHASVRGHICKTNVTSPTAFRGFGVPQGYFMCETLVTHIADHIHISQKKVRELNFLKEGQTTIYNQPPKDISQLVRCWNRVIEQSDYLKKRAEVDNFNSSHRSKKRGLSVIPLLMGTGLLPEFLNQGGVLIQIYKDGTVLMSHGGIEMGQGINTLMVQVASHYLGIPTEDIHTSEASTDKVPNSSATAASHTADIIGFAIKNACGVLHDRLAPFKRKIPNGSFKEWVVAAYMDRVCLSVTGFAKFGTVNFDFGSLQGSSTFEYLTYGAACSEVEIDCLTGEHKVLRTDIVMDVGKSINPGIDVGQIEGAFVQGLGLFTLEELPYTSDGKQLYCGPATYNVPRVHHIPGQLNVTLLKESHNPLGICSSKGIGEPPFLSALAVFFALREAVISARKDSGKLGSLVLCSPLTTDKIRIACRGKDNEKEEKILLQRNFLIKH